MKKQIISTITIAILAVASLLVFTGASGPAPQYSVVTGVDVQFHPDQLETLLNQKSKDGWKLHSFNTAGGVAIFQKD